MIANYLVTPPTNYAVSLARVAQHLYVDNTTDNEIISTYVEAATSYLETICNRAFITASYQMVSTSTPDPLNSVPLTNGAIPVLPLWANFQPLLRRMNLARSPLQSVSSIVINHQYYGTSTTLNSATDYNVDTLSTPSAIIFNQFAFSTNDQIVHSSSEIPAVVMQLIRPFKIPSFGSISADGR
jgi:hypothetical protein